MRKITPYFFVIFLIAVFTAAKAQNAAINTSGNSNYTGAILDLSDNNTNGPVGFLPPYVNLTSATILNPPIVGGIGAQLSGLLVYNTNPAIVNGLSGPGLYYWNNTLATPAWVYIGPGGITGNGTINYLARWLTATTLGVGVAQDNGLGAGVSAAPIVPKSLLDVNGNISVGAYAGVNAAPANGMIVSGQVGIGNNAPNAEAIVDLTNAGHLGLMLPTMTNAQLPAITPAQNGLVVFNSTIGCPEYAVGGVWTIMSGSTQHGNITFNYTGYIQVWVVPPCVTAITISAKGGQGGAGGNTGGSGAVVPAMNFNVTPGHVLMIIVGQQGNNFWGYGAGGGGASYVWDPATPANPLIVAGGGGGGGGTGTGGLNAGTTTAATSSANTGAGGAGGGAGVAGTGAAGGGAGAGWNTAAAVPAALAAHLGQGGLGQPQGFTGGSGSVNQNETGGLGGFGGGGGGGSSTTAANYGGGGGGSGYNGGGGGNGTNASAAEYGGGGGSSGYYNGAIFTNAPGTTATNAGNGSITITW